MKFVGSFEPFSILISQESLKNFSKITERSQHNKLIEKQQRITKTYFLCKNTDNYHVYGS